MRCIKIIILCCVVFITSCQKDDIFIGPELPKYNMIFESPISQVSNGEEISFNTTSDEKHQLIITQINGSVITKESFIPIIGLNHRVIYTSILPKGELVLILRTPNSEISKTRIIVE